MSQPSRPKESLYDLTNASTRIDLYEELGDHAASAVRAFCRRLGAAQLFDESMLPMLHEGDSYLFAAVRDRPWPPWGIGASYVSALCHVHQIGHDTYSVSPVYVAEENLCNIGLIAALYKEALEFLARAGEAEIAYLVAEGSILADHVLTTNGFRKGDDVFLTESARYFTYRAEAARLLRQLGLADLGTSDLLAHDFDRSVLERNAAYHGTIYLASRQQWFRDLVAEIVRLPRGGHDSKAGGVSSGTGRFAFFGDPKSPVVVRFESFLTEEERAQLLEFVLSCQDRFEPSMVVQGDPPAPVINERARRSKTIHDLGSFDALFAERIRSVLPEVLERLKYPKFPVADIEMQISGSNDGDFFQLHSDNEEHSTCEITFVYYFFREPQRFSGGQLRVFETQIIDGKWVPVDRSQTLAPNQGVIVFFPSRHEHEVLPVRVPSRAFADSRFTVTGWIYRK